MCDQVLEPLLKDCVNKVMIDEHTTDQLIVFMALAAGTSKILVGTPSLHTRTAIHFAQLLTGARVDIQQLDSDRYLIVCEGVGRHPRDVS